jgi:hypothetical protein
MTYAFKGADLSPLSEVLTAPMTPAFAQLLLHKERVAKPSPEDMRIACSDVLLAAVLRIPYKGYEISVCTVRHAEIAIFNGNEHVFTLYGVTADDLLKAFRIIDALSS